MPMMSESEQRFWRNTDRSKGLSDCWLWTGAKNNSGYGTFRIGGQKSGAHRISYELKYGKIPGGLHMDHFRCSRTDCVNPDHVRPVTIRENLLRSDTSLTAICAAKTHCPQGHEYSEENTYHFRGSRYCRACKRVHQEKHQAKIRKPNTAPANAKKTHCIRGHEFSYENTYVEKNGARKCRACKRVRRASQCELPKVHMIITRLPELM